MTTTTTGPMVTEAMVDAANSKYWSIGEMPLSQGRMKTILEAALAAMPAAEPDMSNGPLTERVEKLEQSKDRYREAQNIIVRRLDAHDAALAELRDVVNQHDMALDLMRSKCICGVFDTCSCGKDYGWIGPIPPAVSDATANRFSPFINPWAEDEAAETAAPPPLVVTPELIDQCELAYTDATSRDSDRKGIYSALEHAAAHWNATRVPAGDDQGDTPAVSKDGGQ